MLTLFRRDQPVQVADPWREGDVLNRHVPRAAGAVLDRDALEEVRDTRGALDAWRELPLIPVVAVPGAAVDRTFFRVETLCAGIWRQC